MSLARPLASSGLVAVTLLTACASAPAWRTWHSASCDATFDTLALPASGRSVSNTAWGDAVLTTHTEDRPDGSRLIFGCRDIPPGYFATRTEDAIAREVLDAEVASFDDTWARSPVVQTAPNAVMETLTSKDGKTAEVRIAASGRVSRTHGSIVLGLPKEIAAHFVASIHPDPAPARDVRLRSAECLSEVRMPGWPEGSFVPGVATHLFSDASGNYQLRCIFLDEATQKKTPAELFALSKTDTEQDTGMVESSHSDVEIAHRYGRDFVFDAKDGSLRMWVRFLVDGDRVQVATFKGDPKEVARGQAFITSLRPLRDAR